MTDDGAAKKKRRNMFDVGPEGILFNFSYYQFFFIGNS